jgi:hypothetical protein
MGEDTDDGKQLVGRIAAYQLRLYSDSVSSPFHQTQKGSVESVGLLQLVGVLTQEEVTRVDEVADDKTEDFTEVKTSDHLLERLEVSSRQAVAVVNRQLTCSFGLLEDSSMMISYFVRAGDQRVMIGGFINLRKCWCSNESNAPHSHYASVLLSIGMAITYVDGHSSSIGQTNRCHLRDVL